MMVNHLIENREEMVHLHLVFYWELIMMVDRLIESWEEKAVRYDLGESFT